MPGRDALLAQIEAEAVAEQTGKNRQSALDQIEREAQYEAQVGSPAPQDIVAPPAYDPAHVEERRAFQRQQDLEEGGPLGWAAGLPVVRDVVSGARQGVRGLGAGAAAMMRLGGVDAAKTTADDLLAENVGDEAAAAARGGETPGNLSTGRVLRGATTAATQMAIGSGAGRLAALTGNAAVTRGAIGLATALPTLADADQRAREEGLTGGSRAGYQLAQWGIQGLFDSIFPAGAEGALAKQMLQPAARDAVQRGLFDMIRRAAPHIAGEVAQENATNLASSLFDRAALPSNRGRPLGDVLAEWAQSIPETSAVSALLGGGASVLGDLGRNAAIAEQDLPIPRELQDAQRRWHAQGLEHADPGATVRPSPPAGGDAAAALRWLSQQETEPRVPEAAPGLREPTPPGALGIDPARVAQLSDQPTVSEALSMTEPDGHLPPYAPLPTDAGEQTRAMVDQLNGEIAQLREQLRMRDAEEMDQGRTRETRVIGDPAARLAETNPTLDVGIPLAEETRGRAEGEVAAAERDASAVDELAAEVPRLRAQLDEALGNVRGLKESAAAAEDAQTRAEILRQVGEEQARARSIATEHQRAVRDLDRVAPELRAAAERRIAEAQRRAESARTFEQEQRVLREPPQTPAADTRPQVPPSSGPASAPIQTSRAAQQPSGASPEAGTAAPAAHPPWGERVRIGTGPKAVEAVVVSRKLSNQGKVVVQLPNGKRRAVEPERIQRAEPPAPVSRSVESDTSRPAATPPPEPARPRVDAAPVPPEVPRAPQQPAPAPVAPEGVPRVGTPRPEAPAAAARSAPAEPVAPSPQRAAPAPAPADAGSRPGPLPDRAADPAPAPAEPARTDPAAPASAPRPTPADSAAGETAAAATPPEAGKGPTEQTYGAGLTPAMLEAAAPPFVALAQPVKRFSDWWSKPLVEVVRGEAGPLGAEIAEKAKRALDRTREIQGTLAEPLKRALTLARGLSATSREAVRSLRAIEWAPTNDYGFSRFQETVEGHRDATATERPLVDAYRDLVQRTGQLAVQAGIQVDDPATGGKRPFVPAKDGKRLIRAPTPELFDILSDPQSQEYQRLTQILATANGIQQPVVIQALAGFDRAATRPAAVEIARTLKVFPTHMRGSSGAVIPLLHAEPFGAMHAVVRSTAMRLGYVSQFGQGDPDALARDFVAKGGSKDHIQNLTRALNGMPLDAPSKAKPGSAAETGARFLRTMLGLMKTGMLSMSFIPNTVESLGKTRALAGNVRWARALGALVAHPQSQAIESARHGARTVEVINWMSEPGRRMEWMARIARATVNAPANLVNELNEAHAAIAGRIMAEDLRAGRASELDRVRLQVMGFTPAETAQLLDRTASPDLYRAIESRMAEVTQGSTSLPADASRAASSRWWPVAVAFDRFAQMTWNRTMRVNAALAEGLRSKDRKRQAAALAVAADYYLGATASGAATVMLRALVYGGAAGLAIAAAGAKDDPWEFAKESMLYTLLGGPTEAVRRGVTGADLKDVANVSLPISLLQELRDMVQGDGRYRDMSDAEKSAEFLASKFPLSRGVSSAAAMLGLGSKDLALEQSIRAYWRFVHDRTSMRMTTTKPGEGAPATEEARRLERQHEEFRQHMRRAVLALKRSPVDEATAVAEFAQAVRDAKHGKLSIRQSLLAKRLLPDLKEQEQRDRLRVHIGDAAYRRLEAWDATLTGWAARIPDAAETDEDQHDARGWLGLPAAAPEHPAP